MATTYENIFLVVLSLLEYLKNQVKDGAWADYIDQSQIIMSGTQPKYVGETNDYANVKLPLITIIPGTDDVKSYELGDVDGRATFYCRLLIQSRDEKERLALSSYVRGALRNKEFTIYDYSDKAKSSLGSAEVLNINRMSYINSTAEMPIPDRFQTIIGCEIMYNNKKFLE